MLKCSKFQQYICKITLTQPQSDVHIHLAFLVRHILVHLSYKNEYINFCSMKSICFQTNVFRIDEILQFPSSRKTSALCNLLEIFSGFQQVISLTNIFTCILRSLISCIFYWEYYPVMSFTNVKCVCHSQLC